MIGWLPVSPDSEAVSTFVVKTPLDQQVMDLYRKIWSKHSERVKSTKCSERRVSRLVDTEAREEDDNGNSVGASESDNEGRNGVDELDMSDPFINDEPEPTAKREAEPPSVKRARLQRQLERLQARIKRIDEAEADDGI